MNLPHRHLRQSTLKIIRKFSFLRLQMHTSIEKYWLPLPAIRHLPIYFPFLNVGSFLVPNTFSNSHFLTPLMQINLTIHNLIYFVLTYKYNIVNSMIQQREHAMTNFNIQIFIHQAHNFRDTQSNAIFNNTQPPS